MRAGTASQLFTGTLLAASGYGATFLLSNYFRAHGGSDVDTGLTLGMAMTGTLVGVPLVGWLSGRFDAARMGALAVLALAGGFLLLGTGAGQHPLVPRAAGFLIGLGWGMFYISAPMALSERVTDAERGFWFTRFGAFQMAGIGGGPILLATAIDGFGWSIDTTFLFVAAASLCAAGLLWSFSANAPLPRGDAGIRPWVGHIGKIGASPSFRPICMVCLGACVFSGLMSFQSALVEGTVARASTFFGVYAVTVVAARLLLAGVVSRRSQAHLAIVLLLLLCSGVASMFAVGLHPAFQVLSAMLTGVGYGLVYPVIQTWAVNRAEPGLRHAALTWFIVAYFIGIFGFPAVGGIILVQYGKVALLAVLFCAALAELGLALLPERRPRTVVGFAGTSKLAG